MREENFGFDFSPEVEDLEIDAPEDIGELIDEGVIGYPEEYGFESYEEFMRSWMHDVDGSEAYRILQDQRRDKWRTLSQELEEAGGVLYNPENGDQYYTDKEGIH